jgi:hypothetical protein
VVLCKGQGGARVDGIKWSCARADCTCECAALVQLLVMFNQKLRTCHVHDLYVVIGSGVAVGVCTTFGDRLPNLHCLSLH